MKTCKYCGNVLENERNTFCNQSCAAKYNNPLYKVKESKLCINCGTALPANKRHNTFCNLTCSTEYVLKNKMLPLFYAGKIQWNKQLRRILIYLFGDKCMKCGIAPEWEGAPLVMEVHHVDGNSDNNMPDNVKLLCPNCHSQTGTFNGKNKNTKRNEYYRKRYHTAIV